MSKTTIPQVYDVATATGSNVQSPRPVVQRDGYEEITLGDPNDRYRNVGIYRNEGEAFWRFHLPDHDDSPAQSVEMQIAKARLVMQAAGLVLLLNDGTLGGRA